MKSFSSTFGYRLVLMHRLDQWGPHAFASLMMMRVCTYTHTITGCWKYYINSRSIHIYLLPLVAETRVFFERESYSVAEDAGSVSLCVRREGENSESLSIQVATSNLSPVDARGM